MKLAVTGSRGLIGWHIASRLFSENCKAVFGNATKPFEVVTIDHLTFDNDQLLVERLSDVDIVFHCAGVNRAPDQQIEIENQQIAERLVWACNETSTLPHVVYMNSIHCGSDTAYGRSKEAARQILNDFTSRFSNVILPHIYGEGARPYYNNVTATFIEKILRDEEIQVNSGGNVDLLHAGSAAEIAINSALEKKYGDIRPISTPMSVTELLSKLQYFHSQYTRGIYPKLDADLDLTLFNSYRYATFPSLWPRSLTVHSDERGDLFEVAKCVGGGQTFISTTLPGIKRGNHFHLKKVERFLVISGEAKVCLRRVLGDEVLDFYVDGEYPSAIDIPTMYTHSIENVGDKPLITVFWAHEIFDPGEPDTYFDLVVK